MGVEAGQGARRSCRRKVVGSSSGLGSVLGRPEAETDRQQFHFGEFSEAEAHRRRGQPKGCQLMVRAEANGE
jgi:hypothetical protein